MPSVLPLGDPAPQDGLLPAQAGEGADQRAFGLYVHIPFCAVRCGYCDFNTYTATELGGGASQDAYAATAISEVEFAGRVLKESGLPERPLSTVFLAAARPRCSRRRIWRAFSPPRSEHGACSPAPR